MLQKRELLTMLLIKDTAILQKNLTLLNVFPLESIKNHQDIQGRASGIIFYNQLMEKLVRSL
jgi:hypothetical protein